MGQGSNLLIADKGITGVTIFLQNIKSIKIVANNKVAIAAGLTLPKMLSFLKENGLSGAEFLTGIPGSVGGAIIMNAGIKGLSFSRILEKIVYLNERLKIVQIPADKIKFGYRHSILPKNCLIVLGAIIKLEKASPKIIEMNMQRYLKPRIYKQPQKHPNAGSIFKNPPGAFAGKLIELCGCKGLKSGKAQISEKHANFIVNLGKAKAKDVIKLMRMVEQKVYKKFKIKLEPEIVCVGFN